MGEISKSRVKENPGNPIPSFFTVSSNRDDNVYNALASSLWELVDVLNGAFKRCPSLPEPVSLDLKFSQKLGAIGHKLQARVMVKTGVD